MVLACCIPRKLQIFPVWLFRSAVSASELSRLDQTIDLSACCTSP